MRRLSHRFVPDPSGHTNVKRHTAGFVPSGLGEGSASPLRREGWGVLQRTLTLKFSMQLVRPERVAVWRIVATR